MEEFKNFCASMAGAPDVITKINDIFFQAKSKDEYNGADCFQPMADNIQELNSHE